MATEEDTEKDFEKEIGSKIDEFQKKVFQRLDEIDQSIQSKTVTKEDFSAVQGDIKRFNDRMGSFIRREPISKDEYRKLNETMRNEVGNLKGTVMAVKDGVDTLAAGNSWYDKADKSEPQDKKCIVM